jgi:tetratricopeptide (TPR) repeat protein
MARKQGRRETDSGRSQPEPTKQSASRSSTITTSLICLALVLAVCAIYGQTYRFGFIAYDDDTYVYKNDVVKEGLTPAGVSWALKSYCCANWHPLTMLSHMLDCELFGLEAGAHHLVNVALHAANAVLLFLLFARMTGYLWRSAIVAAVFALHPLHVESVAWVAERKDVLSTFLGLVAALLYVRYAKAPSVGRYVAVTVAFGLAIMAKSMLVTLPLVFLLLDIWPLRRLQWRVSWLSARRALLDKVPLLMMSAAVSVVTVFAQRGSGAVMELQRLPFSARFENAVVAYASYIGKAFWPANLAVLYPYDVHPLAKVLVASALLVALSVAAVVSARKCPYAIVGWLWYLGMLVPVIGLVQVGAQSMADRYTYLPLVGLSAAVVWLAADLLAGKAALTRVGSVVACAVLVLFAVQTYRQAGYWISSRALFEHTLAVTKRNHIIHNNLGVVLAGDGRYDEAISCYKRALEIEPDYADARANVGHVFLALGRLDEAYAELARTLELKPAMVEAHTDMGTLLAAQGRYDESAGHLEESLRLSPAQPNVHSNYAFVLTRLGRADEAISHCNEALRAAPESVDARYNLGMALLAKGSKAGAAAEFSRVLALAPDNAAVRAGLSAAQAP